MLSNKIMISFMAVIVAMVFMCHLTSAADLVSTGAVNGTSKGNLVNKPAVPIAPVVASTHQVNATEAHLRVTRKGSGIGGAVAGGVASGAAMTLIGGLLGGRV